MMLVESSECLNSLFIRYIKVTVHSYLFRRSSPKHTCSKKKKKKKDRALAMLKEMIIWELV